MNADRLTSTPPTIYVVIPVHNRREITRSCLQSLYAQNDPNVVIIVVDDGSTDGTSTMVETDFSQTHLLKGDGNLWWTGATNLGIKKGMELGNRDDLILLLNDDLIIKPGYFQSLRSAYESFPNSLIGSVVLEMDNPELIKEGGVHINWFTAKYDSPNSGRQLSSYPEDYVEEVDYLTGRGVLIPIKVFEAIGLYDDQTFKQCGDTELPVRAKRHGYRLLVPFQVKVYSFPELDDNINRKQTYTLSEFKKYFFSFRSNMSLTCRYWQARRMIPNVFKRISYLTFDFLRITYRYFSHLQLR